MTEQITDEYLWFMAMVETAFEGKEYYNNLFQQEEEAAALIEKEKEVLQKLADGVHVWPNSILSDIKITREIYENNDDKKLLDKENENPSPPVLFEFCLGESPRLPVFGRHFRLCSSDVSGSCTEAYPVLQDIFNHLTWKLERN